MATKKKGKKVPKPKRAPAKKVTSGGRPPKKESWKKVRTKKKSGTSSTKTRTPSRGENAAFGRNAARSRSGTQSGDLQGLRNIESADSESVNELLEEGNAFEADVVAGVEHADADQEREVHTQEVPEDDVPGEYLDKD
jgi:hypothetical protein